MNYDEMAKIIRGLGLGAEKVVYKDDRVALKIFRPKKLGGSLKNKEYDVMNNFQIILEKQGQDSFLPNHLRALLNLDLMMKTNPEDFEKFYQIIEKIYEGADPDNFKEQLSKLSFRFIYDSPYIILCYIQLFMLEQDLNYTTGKVQPPRAYLMGYIRFLRTGEQNIDKILWSATRHPPRVKFWRDWEE
ncbi:hypothetical protein GF352_04970 [archaeon]|nr:hypothetical protein [archaeon]